jgi:hypothetical protein
MSTTSKTNPFTVTTAVDYTDRQIRDFWVALPGGPHGERLFEPADPTPLYLLGAKGSGRTHLLRYHSYRLRRLGEHPLDEVRASRFVAVYFRCEGLNAGRFEDYLPTDQQKDVAFPYYFDLTIAIILLELESQLREDGLDKNEPWPDEICELSGSNITTAETATTALRRERRRIDSILNNMPFHTTADAIDFQIKSNRGELIKAMADRLHGLLRRQLECDIQIVVFLDEFENFSLRQQRYVNTLVRERPPYLSLKIGARTEGVKTPETFSANEANVGGAEHQIVYQDQAMRKTPQQYAAGEGTNFGWRAGVVSQVPGFAGLHSPTGNKESLVIGVGYETELIRAVTAKYESAAKIPVFSLPSTQADFYQESVICTARAEDSFGPDALLNPRFMPASDPFQIAKQLYDIVEQLLGEDAEADVYLAPLATKVQALGFAAYYIMEEATNKAVSIVFPFGSSSAPRRESTGHGKIWRYVFERRLLLPVSPID